MFHGERIEILENRVASVEGKVDSIIQRLNVDSQDSCSTAQTPQPELKPASDLDNLRALVRRYLDATGSSDSFSYALGPDWSFAQAVEKLENEMKRKAERDKVEVILRDLLKANVFKQVGV
jgi:hypothetical protein